MTDAPATSQTICACQEVHCFRCQFPDAPATYHFDGKDWCMFHLPLDDGNGNPSPKASWKREELIAFAQSIGALLDRSEHLQISRADFRVVVFPHDFSFGMGHQPYNANFTGAAFGNRVSFKNVQFMYGTGFDNTKFGSDVNFDLVNFGESASFKKASFGSNASFSHATFGNNPCFDYAKFGIGADFSDANFSARARFTEATFGDRARFDNAILGDRIDFSGAKFLGEVTFSIRKEKHSTYDLYRTNFSSAEFHGPVSFENRAFQANTSFNNAEFHDLVKFHGCTFHQGMSFHNTEFHNTHGGYDAEGFENDAETEALERSYRTLKLGMETLRARNEEAYFFAKEMECRRHRSDIGFFAWLAATVYKHLSSYGRSILRPVLWLGGLTLFMWGVYFTIGFLTLPATSNPAHDTYYVVVEPWRTARFTLEQMFRPFAIWSSPINEDVPVNPDDFSEAFTRPEKTYPRLYGILIPILASVQSLATIGLLTLFLLALRRRFKMD